MQRLRDGGHIANMPRTFARNRLVIIAPADNPAGICSVADLAQPGLLLVLAAPDVPVRDYTDAMLDLLTAAPGFGPTYRDAVLANVVSEEDNVRQVAAKVALGEADAGVVYSSDVTPDIADKVVQIDVPDDYNTLADYPIARVTGTADAWLGWQFIRFVLSDEGQALLAKWGFIPA
jgi:molybdate transport system substrate-binding protein